MSQESREHDNNDMFDWEDQLEIPHEWGDLPEIQLDPEIDSHYWGFWQDADSLESNGPPESLRIASEQCMQEEKRHVDESGFRDMCSKLRVAETKVQELEAKLKEARDLLKEKDAKCTELERKLQDVEKKNEGLQEKFNQVLLDQEQQDAKCANLQSKLQEMEGENESLQQKLDLALGKKATILKEKKELKMKHGEVKARLEDTEKRHRVVQVKLDDMMKQNKSLHGLLHKAHQSNAAALREMEAKHRADLLKEKQELSTSQKQLQDVLQNSEKSNGELREKVKKLQQYKQEMEKICAEKMCAGIEDMMIKNAELEELHNNAQHKAEQREKMLKDMQEAQKLAEKKFKELKESHEEKHEIIEELKIQCEKLEELNAESVSDLHNIILQHKDLQERCMKKKKRFKFFRRNSSSP